MVIIGILGGGLLVIAVLTIVYVIGVYNKLTSLRERYKNAFAQIEVQLKRRYDLIPNLVETAKGYLKHERETLEAVIAARNQASSRLQSAASNPSDEKAIGQLGSAESGLARALGQLSVVVERYPELKANQNMMQVSEELSSTENKVAFARQAFNDMVTAYNIYRKQFPAVFFASMFGHTQDASLLEFADAEAIKEAPKVSFA